VYNLTVVAKCQKRISGFLLYRIDIHIEEVPRVDCEKLSGDRMESQAHPSVPVYKPHVIFSIYDSQIIIPTCTSGRYDSIAGCGIRVRI